MRSDHQGHGQSAQTGGFVTDMPSGFDLHGNRSINNPPAFNPRVDSLRAHAIGSPPVHPATLVPASPAGVRPSRPPREKGLYDPRRCPGGSWTCDDRNEKLLSPFWQLTEFIVHYLMRHLPNCRKVEDGIYRCEFERLGCSFQGAPKALADHTFRNHKQAPGTAPTTPVPVTPVPTLPEPISHFDWDDTMDDA